MNPNPLLLDLWREVGFDPNPNQRRAVLHTKGPLHLPAGPGSGKTRVLLWRTVNLIVCHGVSPDRIFLSTFTEKAARQLREGVNSLLAMASSKTGCNYDTSRMYVGTVHSLCANLLRDRRLNEGGERPEMPLLLDELGQFFHLHDKSTWSHLGAATGLPENEVLEWCKEYFGARFLGRHEAVKNCLGVFNRFSEELIDPAKTMRKTRDVNLRRLLRFYAAYLNSLEADGPTRKTDFSQLQRLALAALKDSGIGDRLFDHVIVDEYQDTNYVQECVFFRLAGATRNICVVGDDDQALYRFRGATVENFVEFPERCARILGIRPRQIPLAVNYRSRGDIVAFCEKFLARCNWSRPSGGSWRIAEKRLRAAATDANPSVVTTVPDCPEKVSKEVAQLVRRLVDSGRVEDPNQIAFLFFSLKAKRAEAMMRSLEQAGFKVHAPRANPFLTGNEATIFCGLLARLWGRPPHSGMGGSPYNDFQAWLEDAELTADRLIQRDRPLGHFIRKNSTNENTDVLDMFYRLCGFQPFQQWLDLAQTGIDEGPACNLSQLSHYLSRFQEDFAADQKLTRWNFQLRFWMQFIYPLFCRGETEAEDQENPFPRGRIPFLTIHQAKGLEFPVVVLGSPYRRNRGPALVEHLLDQIRRRRGEPLERMEEFDRMRLFYVALSRAQNLLVIPNYRGQGQCCSPPFKDLLPSLPLARDLAAKSVPKAEPAKAKLPQTYSYTGDFLFFNTCPRQFLIFRRLGFAPARVQTRFFGNLVHRTIEDLHQHLIAARKIR